MMSAPIYLKEKMSKTFIKLCSQIIFHPHLFVVVHDIPDLVGQVLLDEEDGDIVTCRVLPESDGQGMK